MSETQFRHLSVLLPRLSLLQPVRPAPIPEWAEGQFANAAGVRDEELFKKIIAYIKGLQDTATMHGTGGLLAAVSSDWGRSGAHESRFSIQSTLRGNAPAPPDPEEQLLFEAAVFLELARDLDERDMDLESGSLQVDKLEAEFRNILGAVDEVELQEMRDVATYSISSDKTNISFMLRKRMAYWYRLFANMERIEPTILTVITQEVIDELLEPVRKDWAHEGKELKVSRIPLATIPALDRLDPKTFLELKQKLEEPDSPLASFRQELEKTLKAPQTLTLESSMDIQAEAENCRQYVEDFCRQSKALGQQQVRLTLIRFENMTHDDFWRYLDDLGYEMWEGELSSMGPAVMLSIDY
jgi:hypothetical protein